MLQLFIIEETILWIQFHFNFEFVAREHLFFHQNVFESSYSSNITLRFCYYDVLFSRQIFFTFFCCCFWFYFRNAIRVAFNIFYCFYFYFFIIIIFYTVVSSFLLCCLWFFTWCYGIYTRIVKIHFGFGRRRCCRFASMYEAISKARVLNVLRTLNWCV